MVLAQTLIDKARQKHEGSRRKLAAQIGQDPAFLGRIERGEKPMPPGIAVLCALEADTDPIAAALAAVVDQEPDATKRAVLARALKLADWRRR